MFETRTTRVYGGHCKHGVNCATICKRCADEAKAAEESLRSWDEYFIKFAILASEKSKDRSAKVGAVIVGPANEIRSTGYNNFPRGIDDDVEERHERPAKYSWTEHAERNAIFNAARHGASLEGCRMYLNWEPYPCPDCARAVIQAGIVEVIGPNIPFGGKRRQNQIDWQKTFEVTRKMFEEAGVKTRIVEFERP